MGKWKSFYAKFWEGLCSRGCCVMSVSALPPEGHLQMIPEHVKGFLSLFTLLTSLVTGEEWVGSAGKLMLQQWPAATELRALVDKYPSFCTPKWDSSEVHSVQNFGGPWPFLPTAVPPHWYTGSLAITVSPAPPYSLTLFPGITSSVNSLDPSSYLRVCFGDHLI